MPPGDVVLVRNHHKFRHLLYPLRDMAVELLLETTAVGASIGGFAEEQCVKPGALRAVRAASRPGYERFIVLRKRNGFEAEVHIALNPFLQTADGNECAFAVVRREVAVKAEGERFLLDIGGESRDDQGMFDANLP